MDTFSENSIPTEVDDVHSARMKPHKKRLWSPTDDEQLIAWRKEALPFPEMAERMGATTSAVRQRVYALLKLNPIDVPEMDNNASRRGKGRGIAFLRENVGYASDDCLPWPMSRGARDVSAFVGFEGHWYSAHRVMCILAHGKPPAKGYMAAHTCGDSNCVNPKHLFWKVKRNTGAGSADIGLEAPAANLPAVGAGAAVEEVEPPYVEILPLKGGMPRRLRKYANPQVGELVSKIGALACSCGELIEIYPNGLARVEWYDVGHKYMAKSLCHYRDLFRCQYNFNKESA
jgi:hypothetical protein